MKATRTLTPVYIVMVSMGVLFGTSYVIGKYVLQFVTPSAWAFIRAALSAIILLAVTFPRWKKEKIGRRELGIMALLGLLGVSINQICFFEGLARTTVTHSAIINSCVPVFTLLIGLFLGLEKTNYWRILGIGLSAAGVLSILGISHQSFNESQFTGDLLNVVNSLSYSFYLIFSRSFRARLSPLVLTSGMFVFGAFFNSFYGASAAWDLPWSSFSMTIYLGMFFLVFFATVVPYLLNNWALGRAESSFVSLYIYIQTVVAGLLSYLILGETLTVSKILASLMVFAGIALGSLTPKRKEA